MRAHTRILTTLAGVVAGTALVVGQGQGYKITVSQDRLINAQNEPQNWLLMNGDYGSTRYSKLTQINRDNVKNLRMVWAMALGGMQDVGQNGPENEVNPLIDNGFMYTTDGWGTVYKIDARNPDRGKFVWMADAARAARGQRAAHARHRALGGPGRRQPAGRPRHRDQPRQRRDRLGQEDRRQERVRRPGEVSHGAARRRRQGASSRTAPATRGTRGWVAALDVKTGNELWRFYTVPKPGDPGSETLERRSQRVEDRRRRHLADRLVRSGHASSTSSAPATRIRSTTRSSVRATTCTRTRSIAHQRRDRQARLAFPVHAERLVGLRRSRRAHAVRHDDRRRDAEGRRPLRAQRLLLHARSHQRQVHQGRRSTSTT